MKLISFLLEGNHQHGSASHPEKAPESRKAKGPDSLPEGKMGRDKIGSENKINRWYLSQVLFPLSNSPTGSETLACIIFLWSDESLFLTWIKVVSNLQTNRLVPPWVLPGTESQILPRPPGYDLQCDEDSRWFHCLLNFEKPWPGEQALGSE